MDRGGDLQSVPHDAVVTEQPFHIARSVAGDFFRAESVEGFPIGVSFLQNSYPTQSRLRAFQNEKLKQQSIIVYGNAPFLIMISNGGFSSRPRTAWHKAGTYITAEL